MEADLPFDRKLRRLRRDRAARIGAEAAYLHQRVAEEIVERLGLVTRSFGRALVLGAGHSRLAQMLQARDIHVVAADPGLLFARDAQCDEDRLPFGDDVFDLVISLGLLDSVNDLPGALLLIRRTLRPDGLFLGAFAGAGSLPRLRRAMQAAEEAQSLPASPRIHPQIDVRAAGDLLGRAGFALQVADVESVTVRFSSLLQLVADLRGMGAANMLVNRARRPITRIGLAAAIANFAADAGGDGKTAERFEIVHLSAWSPAPDQPQPARRGSATASLAAALPPRR